MRLSVMRIAGVVGVGLVGMAALAAAQNTPGGYLELRTRTGALQGSSRDSGHPGWIEIDDVTVSNVEAENPQSSKSAATESKVDTTSAKVISFLKAVDKSSPVLRRALASRETFQGGTLDLVSGAARPGDRSPAGRRRISFQSCVVTSIVPARGSTAQRKGSDMERVTMRVKVVADKIP